MSTITWLADLPGRSRRARQPSITEHARALAAERMKLDPDDPRIQVAALETEHVLFMLNTQEQLYERKLTICYAVITGLAAALIFATVLIAALAGML